jgi:hypothetical protein
MTPTIVILANGFVRTELTAGLGSVAIPFATSFVHDTVAIARSVRGARVVLRHGPGLPSQALAGIGPDVRTAPIRSTGAAELAHAVGDALADGGPALILSATLPHLPSWRLRDALTYLADGVDAVIGPSDQGDWYLLGMRAPTTELLRSFPGYGESAQPLAEAASRQGGRVALLPPWFGIQTRADLEALAEALRTMPHGVAPQTRSLFDAGMGYARALGG